MKNRGLKNFLVFFCVIGFTSLSLAQEKKEEVESKKEQTPKKVDIKTLERKYWEPKDKNFKVVQNRTFTKTKKLALTLMPSLMLNEEYSQGYGVDIGVGYFFTDQWGVEAELQLMSLEDNDLQKAVLKEGGFVDHSKTDRYMGVTGKWMPFYAKMSFLGTKIVYFDLSLGASIGLMNYQQQVSSGTRTDPQVSDYASKSSLAFGFEVTQSFYILKRLLIRASYKQRFYNEEVVSGASLATAGKFIEDRLEDSISLNLGVTFLFF